MHPFELSSESSKARKPILKRGMFQYRISSFLAKARKLERTRTYIKVTLLFQIYSYNQICFGTCFLVFLFRHLFSCFLVFLFSCSRNKCRNKSCFLVFLFSCFLVAETNFGNKNNQICFDCMFYLYI